MYCMQILYSWRVCGPLALFRSLSAASVLWLPNVRSMRAPAQGMVRPVERGLQPEQLPASHGRAPGLCGTGAENACVLMACMWLFACQWPARPGEAVRCLATRAMEELRLIACHYGSGGFQGLAHDLGRACRPALNLSMHGACTARRHTYRERVW